MTKGEKISYRRIFQMVWPSIRPSWKLLAFFVITGAVLAALGIAEPYIYGSVTDATIKLVNAQKGIEDGLKIIGPFLLAWAIVIVFQTIFKALASFYTWHFMNRCNVRYSEALYRHILSLDLGRFHEQKAGDTLRRFNNAADAIERVIRMLVGDYLYVIMWLVMVFTFGMATDWRLTLLILIPVPLMLATGYVVMKKTYPNQVEANKLWDEGFGVVGDSFSNIASMKAWNGEERSTKQFRSLLEKAFRFQGRVNRWWAATDSSYNSINILGHVVLFVGGLALVLNHSTTIGTVLMFYGLQSSIFGLVHGLMQMLPDLSRQLVRLNRITTTWEEVPVVRDRPKARALPRARGEIAFHGVHFSYRSGRAALRGIDLTVPAGKTFAFVGESGAGKSTLAQLMLRFYEPTRGSITIDGIDLRDLKLHDLRANIGFVMQENLLFHDSILNNIRFAKPKTTRAEVVAAAKRAQAHEFIMRLPKKYDSIVGERGVKLSGGEKQRIALTRVLLANPPILVLDEATSALDSKTEHDLQTALREVTKGRTTLVIAHRLSTVMSADNIVVMDHGRIVDQGKHEELLRLDSLYKQYWKIQAGGYF